MSIDVPRLLFVDDDPVMLGTLRRCLRAHRPDWDITYKGDPLEALASFAADPADLVVSDMHMPGLSGLDMAAAIKGINPATGIIFLTGHPDLDATMRSINEIGAARFLAKPCPPRQLIASISDALAALSARQQPIEILPPVQPAAQVPAGLLQAALDCLSIAIIILDAEGQMIASNQRAEALLDQSTLLLRGAGGQIRPTSREAAMAMDAARLRLTLDEGNRTDRLEVLALPDRSHDLPLPAWLLPLTAAVTPLAGTSNPADPPVLPGDPYLGLFILPEHPAPGHDFRLLTRLYDLAPTEARLVCNLIAGHDLPMAAAETNITLSTARTYLKRIYLKLGVSDRASMICRVLPALLQV